MGRLLLSITLFFAASACASSRPAPRVPAPPEAQTAAPLVGPLCKGTQCRCADDPEDAGKPPEGWKRFEVALGPSEHELWATIDDAVFYKSVERGQECFYIDLEPKEHRFALQARGEAGFGAVFSIRELGTQGSWWYDSFGLSCGELSRCTGTELREWKERIAKVDAGKFAPCGSVRIVGLNWQLGRMPDNLHPEDFHLEGTMKVYKFAPEHPPNSSACSKESNGE